MLAGRQHEFPRPLANVPVVSYLSPGAPPNIWIHRVLSMLLTFHSWTATPHKHNHGEMNRVGTCTGKYIRCIKVLTRFGCVPWYHFHYGTDSGGYFVCLFVCLFCCLFFLLQWLTSYKDSFIFISHNVWPLAADRWLPSIYIQLLAGKEHSGGPHPHQRLLRECNLPWG